MKGKWFLLVLPLLLIACNTTEDITVNRIRKAMTNWLEVSEKCADKIMIATNSQEVIDDVNRCTEATRHLLDEMQKAYEENLISFEQINRIIMRLKPETERMRFMASRLGLSIESLKQRFAAEPEKFAEIQTALGDFQGSFRFVAP